MKRGSEADRLIAVLKQGPVKPSWDYVNGIVTIHLDRIERL